MYIVANYNLNPLVVAVYRRPYGEQTRNVGDRQGGGTSNSPKGSIKKMNENGIFLNFDTCGPTFDMNGVQIRNRSLYSHVPIGFPRIPPHTTPEPRATIYYTVSEACVRACVKKE